MSKTRIVIVGGGASGVLLAADLLHRGAEVDLQVVEPRPELGRGLAYSTPFAVHRLNVRAGRMSGRADDPDHFLRWLRREDETAHEGTFAPRRVYGRYLSELLDEARAAAAPGARFTHVADRVEDVRRQPGGLHCRLAGGRTLSADAVVLALGNLPPAAAPLLPPGGADPARFVVDPWAPQALAAIAPDSPVLLIGLGLTAIDVVLALHERGHRGKVLAVSRHGLLPRTQAAAQPPLKPSAPLSESRLVDLLLPAHPEAVHGLRRLVAGVRAATRRLTEAGGDWHDVFEDLRPVTPALWSGLTWAERRTFLRHLQPYWDAHRHRMPPEVAAGVDAQIASGRLQVRAARVRAFEGDPQGVRVTLAPRGGGPAEHFLAGAVVTCTGPGRLAASRHPLLRSLLAQGLVRTDPTGLGLEARPDGTLLAADGAPSSGLFALGPLLKGVLWESTAVPEIRGQARALAQALSEPAPREAPPNRMNDNARHAPAPPRGRESNG